MRHGRGLQFLITVTVSSALLTVAGCSASGSDPAGSSTQTAGSETSGSAASATDPSATSDRSAGQADAAPAPGATLPVLAEAPGTANGTPVKVALNSVAVNGDLMTVTLTATNTSDEKNDKWQVTGFFSNGVSDAEDNTKSYAESGSADGVYVLDTTNAKRYLVGRGPDGMCACSVDLGDVFVTPGQSTAISATFKAPPADVTSVTVVVPNIAPFTNVAIDR